MDAGPQRLQKILATTGISSRRKSEEIILEGRVKVNGKTIYELGVKADLASDLITVDGKSINPDRFNLVYCLLNKPRGCVSTTEDPQGRPTIMDLVKDIPERVYPVGRLDYASEGLMLLTNDGELTNQITHPKNGITKTYAVKVKGRIPESKLQTLRAGVRLDRVLVVPKSVRRWKKLQTKEWIYIEIGEGKYQEVRRLVAAIGFEVDRLRRIAIGNLKLERIPVGKYQLIDEKSIEQVFSRPQNLAGKSLTSKAQAGSTTVRKKKKLVKHSSRRGK